MSIESVMDMSLDNQTVLPYGFTCTSQVLILSPNLTKLQVNFLYDNSCVKTLDMSKCTKITTIPDNFCAYSCIQHIIWPPNIKIILSCCLAYNIYIQKIDLTYCTSLTDIGSNFCQYTNIVHLCLPISIRTISFNFCNHNKTLIHLDFSLYINLAYIGSYFCAYTNIQYIKFPRSLQIIDYYVCCDSNVNEIDFSECKSLCMNTYKMCKGKILKLYSINNINITRINKIQFITLHIYNIAETKSLDLSFIEGLQDVYLPEGKYCIADSRSKDYLNVKFWIRSSVFPSNHFSELKWYSYIPVHDLVELDIPLDSI
jgi:hypothetical protein